MNKKIILTVIFVLLALCLINSCKKDSSKKPSSINESKTMYDSPKDAQKNSDENITKNVTTQDLDFFLIDDFEKSKKRLLEYNINTTYECADLNTARKTLLEIVNEYGFIKNASSSIKQDPYYINAKIFVDASLLYKSLLDLKKIGKLVSEDITVIDLTENMYIKQKIQAREKIRIDRKKKSIESSSPKDNEWLDKENSLEKSEDSLDKSEIEQWKINDQIAWAKININIKAPEKPYSIVVPSFKNAFLGVINLLLQILYVLIYILPFIIIIILLFVLWKKRVQIKEFFKKDKNK